MIRINSRKKSLTVYYFLFLAVCSCFKKLEGKRLTPFMAGIVIAVILQCLLYNWYTVGSSQPLHSYLPVLFDGFDDKLNQNNGEQYRAD
jgi:hypothetical protein